MTLRPLSLLWALVVVFPFLCARTEAAPNQMVPKGLGATITIPGMISYQVPQGWSTDTETNANPQARGAVSNGIVPDITFNSVNHGSLAEFTHDFQPEHYDTNQSLKYMDQQPFVTAAGVKGIRCRSVSGDSTITQYSYVFLGQDNLQMEVACACATADVNIYLPIFDASMKTVTIAKGD